MKFQTYKHTLVSAMVVCGMVGVASQAHALDIIAGTTTPLATTNDNTAFNADEMETLLGFTAPGHIELALAYKQNFGGSEDGNAQNYYSTAIFPISDPSAATITSNGPMKISCPSCYLAVKDGNHIPAQYVFDISGWNGTDTINLSGFWTPGGGAISYVAIFNAYSAEDGGGSIAAIPEADTYAMLLAGLGLVGFAARRKLGNVA